MVVVQREEDGEEDLQTEAEDLCLVEAVEEGVHGGERYLQEEAAIPMEEHCHLVGMLEEEPKRDPLVGVLLVHSAQDLPSLVLCVGLTSLILKGSPDHSVM